MSKFEVEKRERITRHEAATRLRRIATILSTDGEELEFGGARTVLEAAVKRTGLTPNDYLQRLRIGAAETRLASSDDTVEQIAQDVGYGDRAAFAKLFKRITGNTPSEHRRRAGRAGLPPETTPG